jgi:hypothetical protein
MHRNVSLRACEINKALRPLPRAMGLANFLTVLP